MSSDYHRNFESHPVAKALRLDPLEVSAPKDDFLQSLSLDSSTLLFTHIPAIFFVLHLIYEELKLNSLMGEGIRSLVVLLVQLARYANLTNHRYCILFIVSRGWLCMFCLFILKEELNGLLIFLKKMNKSWLKIFPVANLLYSSCYLPSSA